MKLFVFVNYVLHLMCSTSLQQRRLLDLALRGVTLGQAYFFMARMAFIAAIAFMDRMAAFFLITRMAFIAAIAFIARMAAFFRMTRIAFIAGAAAFIAFIERMAAFFFITRMAF